MRVDIMAKMRGVDDFAKLWKRRVSLQDTDGTVYDLMALTDLVAAKKTQRSKDWPMIQRLVEADYLRQRENATEQQVPRRFRIPPSLIPGDRPLWRGWRGRAVGGQISRAGHKGPDFVI